MPPKKGARGRNAATASPRKLPTGRAQSARICGCLQVGTASADLFKKNGEHTLSKHEPADACLSSGFTTIKILASLQSRIQQSELQLTTSRAIFDRNESRKLIEEAGLQQLELAQRQNEGAARKPDDRKHQQEVRKQQRQLGEFAKQADETARNKTVGFVSFNYGRSVEDRKAVGSSWAANQFINTKSVSQTTGSNQRNTSNTKPAGLASSQFPPNGLNTAQRITGWTINQRKAALGVLDHPSPDQPSFSPVTPVFAHGPIQPLTPADSTTFDILRNSFLDPSQEDLEEMSNKPIYPESGGAAEAIKDVIQNLFTLQQHVHQFRPEQQDGVNRQVENVAKSLSTLDEIVTQPSNPLHNLRVAPEIIEYVDDARNPDIFSREFVELVQRGNSVLNGKQQAFRSFSQIYAKKLKDSFKGIDDEVDLIMSNAGMEERNGKFVDKVQNGH